MYPIPANATRIRYLESTGTQYVDTGYIPTHASAFDVRFAPTNVDFVAHAVYGNARAGASDYPTDERAPLTLWTGNGYNNRFFYSPIIITGYEVGRIYSVQQSANGIVRDGISLGTYDQTQIRPPLNEPIWVFGYINGTTNAFGLLRLYGLAISESGTLVRSFVPCRILDTGYLWDEVEGKFYGNQGTGDFVLGPDVREGVVPTRMNPFGVGRRQEGALYDRVTDTIFRSATSTTLVAGPDKNGGAA